MDNTFFIYGYIEGRKEIFHLTMHSTHFLFTVIWKEGRKEGNISFNDALNTFLIYGYIEGRKEIFHLTMHSTHILFTVI